MTDKQASVRHDAAQRYELLVEGQPLGFAAYSEQGERMVFTHTEVDPSLSGQGLGSVLAKARWTMHGGAASAWCRSASSSPGTSSATRNGRTWSIRSEVDMQRRASARQRSRPG